MAASSYTFVPSSNALHTSNALPKRKPVPSTSLSLIPEYYDAANNDPVGALSTLSRVSTTSSTTQFSLALHFLVKLFLKGLARFLITVALITGLGGTLLLYERRDIIGHNGKRVFNTLVTGLSMTLGISIASSFKNVALDVRWWILSRKKRSMHEVDSILACSSLTEVSLLATRSARNMKPGLFLSCSLWVVFNIAAQAAVAMLGLTYSLNAAIDYNKPVGGFVTFSNMNQSWGKSIDEDTVPSSQLAAHTYGESALEFFPNSTVDPNSLYLQPYIYPTYFKFLDSFTYVFMEGPAAPPSSTSGSQLSWFYSNRSITTTGICTAYTVIDNMNGLSQSFSFEQDGAVHTEQFSSISPNSTTYLNSPGVYDCGPRCANVCGYENNGTAGFYCTCKITVSNVTNAAIPEHRVSDESAKIAAEAIALQGYQTVTGGDQYQRYPPQSWYGTFLGGNATQMAYNMRMFAIGVFATADQILSDIDLELQVEGFHPDQGLKLTVDHVPGMWALFGCIGGSHLVLFLVGVWVANRVVVAEDSYLAIALLLRPVAEGMKDRGCLLDGEEREKRARELEVVYGPLSEEKGDVRALEISDGAHCERHPRGWEGCYDS